MYTRMNNPLNLFITAQEMDFLIIWLIIFFSIEFSVFQFYYWSSRERKILEKSPNTATYNHYIISKFQLNPFIAAQEMYFLIISSLLLEK